MKQPLQAFLLLWLISCSTLPRNKQLPDGVRMVHYIDGVEYRGVSQWDWIFKYKNPRYGEGYAKLAKDPAAVTKKTKKNYTIRVKEYRRDVKRMTMDEWLAYSGQLPEDSATAAQKDSIAKLPKEKPNLLPPDEEEAVSDTL